MNHDGEPRSAFQFAGDWREFAPIAFTNLLLSIVTLGIYRFWASARERRYLWSRTEFIDEPLEWTGTGLELLIGFVLAILIVGVPLFVLQFGIEALVLRGHAVIAGVVAFALYLGLLALAGFAVFRALRYRLSRTHWRGIRGGSDGNGVAYGLTYLWKTFAGLFPMGLLLPWSMVSLWNDRWNRMSFGTHNFESASRPGPLYPRFLLFYLVPAGLFVAAIALAFSMAAAGGRPSGTVFVMLGLLVFAGVYILLPLAALAFYAAYFRNAVGGMRWADLEFGFTARTLDWFKLFLGSLALVIVTLGIGAIFIQYRNWSFFVRHLEAYGEIDLAALGQSTAAEPGQGEGVLDAFDLGAI